MIPKYTESRLEYDTSQNSFSVKMLLSETGIILEQLFPNRNADYVYIFCVGNDFTKAVCDPDLYKSKSCLRFLCSYMLSPTQSCEFMTRSIPIGSV